MDSFLLSTGVVALAEVGDKTQLLSFFLAAKFQRPWPLIWGILAATLLNHALAGVLGLGVSGLLAPELLRWVLGIGFLAMAVWLLIPDKLDDTKLASSTSDRSVFLTSLITFFLAEMGDKTQVATIGLAAHYQDLIGVVLGTTLGMMIANVPAVLIGQRLADRLPKRLIQSASALILAALGAAILVMGP